MKSKKVKHLASLSKYFWNISSPFPRMQQHKNYVKSYTCESLYCLYFPPWMSSCFNVLLVLLGGSMNKMEIRFFLQASLLPPPLLKRRKRRRKWWGRIPLCQQEALSLFIHCLLVFVQSLKGRPPPAPLFGDDDEEDVDWLNWHKDPPELEVDLLFDRNSLFSSLPLASGDEDEASCDEGLAVVPSSSYVRQ